MGDPTVAIYIAVTTVLFLLLNTTDNEGATWVEYNILFASLFGWLLTYIIV